MNRSTDRIGRLVPAWKLCAGICWLAFISAPLHADLADSVLECLACHEDAELTKTLGDGSEFSLQVNADSFSHSIHGPEMLCVDCHAGYDEDHPWEREFANRRDYTLASYEVCKDCHFDEYSRTLEGIHFDSLASGNLAAPVCSDCHGSHDIRDPHADDVVISSACGNCHVDVITKYAASAHGAGLTGDRNVPGCSACHRSHDIESPHTIRFRLHSPQICLDCHADAERMAPYGLTTDVGPTYLSDFHGVTASLSSESEDPRQLVVTCLNCHGYHQIASVKETGAEAMQARVAATCASCHEDTSPDFPRAWLSHYRPSWQHARLVWLTGLFYKFLIPFIVIGLAVQIVLHLARVAMRR